MFFRVSLVLCASAVVAGCVSPKDYETTPVTVASPAGPVLCQLYTHEQVTWDRSINRPESMTVEAADAICRQEGYRLMGASAKPVPAPAAKGTTVVVAPKL